MKTVSVFFLLIYWSIMISAPLMDKNSLKNQNKDLKTFQIF